MTTRASSLDPRALFAGDAARHLATVSDAELRQLRAFCVVVAAGGLSAATAELQSDLSTVSRQFKELEARVGTRLAQRGRGGFALTPAGEQLHQAALQLLGSLQAFRDEVAELAQRGGAVLRLGIVDALLTAGPAIGDGGLPRALAACVDGVPGLTLQLFTLRPIEIERRILAGELDAGILAAHAPAAGLLQQRLHAEASSLYVAPGHPWFDRADEELTLAELEHIACVVDPFSIDLPPPLRSAALRGGHTRADSIEGAALLACTGRFAAFLPDHLVGATAPLAKLRRVNPTLFSHTQDIVLSSRQGNADAALRLLMRELIRS
jgi:LysR family transcriptional regulator, transcriptional activator for bauABCD operon